LKKGGKETSALKVHFKKRYKKPRLGAINTPQLQGTRVEDEVQRGGREVKHRGECTKRKIGGARRGVGQGEEEKGARDAFRPA